MGGSECAVAICKNYNSRTRERNVIYHSFPKDPTLCKQWLVKCKRGDVVNVKAARICSDHFIPDDYERDLRSELLGLPSKRRLKSGAIPSRKLTVAEETTTAVPQVAGYPENDEVLPASPDCTSAGTSFDATGLESIINEPSTSGVAATHSSNIDTPISHPSTSGGDRRGKRHSTCSIRKRAIDTLENVSLIKRSRTSETQTDSILSSPAQKKRENSLLRENEQLKKTIANLTASNTARALEVQNYKKICSQQKRAFKAKQTKIDSSVDDKVTKVLSKIFTPRQIRALTTGKRVKWDQQTISKALTLRAMSRKAYLYLRKHMKMPLPGMTTLRRECPSLTLNSTKDTKEYI